MLSKLSLASPGWLWLLPVAVALVVLVHWLSQRRARPMAFPAMRLIAAQVASVQQPSRLRRWLLMALRLLVLVAVIVAFAQPHWRFASARSSQPRTKHVVVLVDRSASMRRAAQGARLYEKAKERAIHYLQSLDPTMQRVSVIMVDEHPNALLPEPTRNVDALIGRLRKTAVTFERGRMKSALKRARSLHRVEADEAADLSRLRLALVSDAQATHWPVDTLARWRQAGAVIDVHRITGPVDNTAVHSVRVTPKAVVQGQTARISARLMHVGDQPRHVRVRLAGEAIAGSPAIRQLQVSEGEQPTVTWSVRFTKRGLTSVRVELVDHTDALVSDNVGGAALHVADAQPVTVLSQMTGDQSDTAVYYLRRALAPETDGVVSRFKATLQSPDAFSSQTLDEGDSAPARADGAATRGGPRPIVLVAEAGGLPDAARTTLLQHLRAGGGVFWLIDSESSAASFNRFSQRLAEDGEQPVLPRVTWHEEGAMQLGSARFDRQPLSVFKGAGREGLLSSTFHGYATLSSAVPPAALLRTRDDEPIMRLVTVGRGRLLLAGLALSPQRTKFVKTPWLVPWLHESLRMLKARSPQPAPLLPGQSLPFDADDTSRVVKPKRATDPRPAPGRADAPGLYQLQSKAGAVLAARWVQFPRSESDLRPARQIAEDEQMKRERDASSSIVNRTGDAAAARRAASSRALWPGCIALGLLLLTLEPWLRARGERRRPERSAS